MSSECMGWLRERGLPESVLADLSECVHAGAIPIGHLWLSPLGEVRLENELEENAPCIEHGFLVVGSGLNGDPIALEIASGRMAFVSHDLLWERDYLEFEECVVRSPLGFDDFWTAAAEQADFPVDADDAASTWRAE